VSKFEIFDLILNANCDIIMWYTRGCGGT